MYFFCFSNLISHLFKYKESFSQYHLMAFSSINYSSNRQLLTKSYVFGQKIIGDYRSMTTFVKMCNMRIKLLLPVMLFPFLLSSQNVTDGNLQEEISNLSKKLENSAKHIERLERRVATYEQNYKSLSESLRSQGLINQEIQNQIKANMELQAQNERAVNVALDEFAKKFEEQNRTMDGVKATLEEHWNQQLLFYLIVIITFIIAMIISIKLSMKKALQKQQDYWNKFNEYIIKK